MAIISAFTLIRTIAIFHITAAYFFLVSPATISDQNVVFILGASMRLPQPTALSKPSDSNAFIAVLLAFFGTADLVAASLSDLVALEYWLSNVPVRLSLLFGLTGYVYLFKEDGMLNSGYGFGNAGEHLCNSWTFSWAFLELMLWFWVYTSLREERHTIARRILEHRKDEEPEE